MASKHILKLTETEAVIKCYITDPAGGVVDISVQNDLTKATQVWVNDGSCKVGIKEIFWGLKTGKQLDITRIVTPPDTVHGHYYLVDAGSYEFKGFHDHVYEEKDIRISFDGPGHCILVLRKEGWLPKVETAQFGSYDNTTVVGS
jgi:hypothetical protein